MIIVDFNQVVLANLMAQMGNHKNAQIQEGMVRHMVLNQLRSFNMKYGHEFGKIVIACDTHSYWRKKLFPYYKANRKKAQEVSEIDWNLVFETLNKIRNELKEYFHYTVIEVETAEADDVIATLVSEFGEELNTGEKILILSGDKDFIQLQTYGNVKQYDPVRKRWIAHNNPEAFLREHIIRGDSGDGIPNILSSDDVFVSKDRQKKITQKRLDQYMNLDPSEIDDQNVKRNFDRNTQLIDLSKIPESIQTKVIEQFKAQQDGRDRSKLFEYFVKFKLNNLLDALSEF